jgi:hypothetical protein
MISILFKNLKKVYDKPYPIGMQLNRTSSAFVKAFTSPQKNHIYIQRGYRQYGAPQVKMKIILKIMNFAFRKKL